MTKPLKILVVTNFYPPQVIGGYERAIADMAALLQQRGHDVLVLTSQLPENLTAPNAMAVERILMLGGEWVNGTAVWYSEAQLVGIDAYNAQAVNQALQRLQPDVCLAGNIDFFGIEVLQPILAAGVPIAHYVMNKMPGYVAAVAPSTPLYRYVTCSDWVRRSLEEAGYPIATATVVYPGAAVDAFYQADLPPHDCLRIAYASLVMPYKGADVLLEALCLLNALGTPFTAAIAGGTLQPEFVQALQALVESEGMADRVRFLGVLSRQELCTLYQECNVLVFPSRFEEPFGISQIEAMAAGLTLVTSGTGGAGEIVTHGEDGLVFESENPLDLADTLSSLVAQPDAWIDLTRRGQQKARSQFSQATAIAQLEAVLQELAASSDTI